MQPSVALAFSRLAAEYSTWRSVDAERRSEAPGWWWAPAFAVRNARQAMPASEATSFGLDNGATYADAARLVLAALEPQKNQPWPDEFPMKPPSPAKDEAASAGSAAQASAAAISPLAGS